MSVITWIGPLIAVAAVALSLPGRAAVVDNGPPTRNGIYFGYQECPAVSCKAKVKWHLMARTPFYVAEGSIRLIGWIPPCTTVTTQGGRGHVIPRRGKVIKASPGFDVGDVLFLLDSDGEGQVNVWRHGREETVALPEAESDIDWDGYGLPEPPRVGWEKVSRPDGRVGWLRNPTPNDATGEASDCRRTKP